jgi:hypothetical protein
MNETIFGCPFCKDVIFFTRLDLKRHLDAGIMQPVPINAPAINPTDHRNYYIKGHKKLEGFWDE